MKPKRGVVAYSATPSSNRLAPQLTLIYVKHPIVNFDVDVDAEPWVADVLRQVQTALDMSQLTVEGFIGLTEPDSAQLTSWSMLDPTHAVWDVENKPDSWVTTETDNCRHIQQLVELGDIDIARVHELEDGEQVDITLVVRE